MNIDVNEVTPPSVSCPPGPNPAGTEPSADNQDGFFRMVASDNVDASVPIYIKDLGSGTVFGPSPSATTFKLTQAPRARSRPRTSPAMSGGSSPSTVTPS